MNKDAAAKAWHDRFHNRAPGPKQKATVTVRAAVDPDTTDILIYDEIGGWDGITDKDVINALATCATPNVNVRINSPGGDAFAGIAIYNALRAHSANVTTTVDGLAASAASIIAMAGSTVKMADNALMMAHCAWSLAIGNSADMKEMAGVLDKLDSQLAGIYAKKSGQSVKACLAMMQGDGKADGTWFTGDEAKEFGLVDEVMTGEAEGPDADEAEPGSVGNITHQGVRLTTSMEDHMAAVLAMQQSLRAMDAAGGNAEETYLRSMIAMRQQCADACQEFLPVAVHGEAKVMAAECLAEDLECVGQCTEWLEEWYPASPNVPEEAEDSAAATISAMLRRLAIAERE